MAEDDAVLVKPKANGVVLEEQKNMATEGSAYEQNETDPSSRMDTTESGAQEPPSPKQAAQGAAIKRQKTRKNKNKKRR